MTPFKKDKVDYREMFKCWSCGHLNSVTEKIKQELVESHYASGKCVECGKTSSVSTIPKPKEKKV